MKLKKLWISAISAMMLITIPAQVGASSNEQQLNQILTLHGNEITLQELKRDIASIAVESGASEQQITAELLKELESKQTSDIGAYSSGGGGGSKQLATSRKGTFFYAPASLGPVNHGHIGIYYTSSVIVEAANSDLGIRKASVSTRKVGKGARIQEVKSTSISQDSKAANWAHGKLGKNNYNKNFLKNRSCGGKKFNCSQLVWCAFKQVAGIDIDKDKGWGVYPVDIRDSSLVRTIKKY
ncbi:hypothetical protein [Paenibacillus arenosi]|uniref:YycO n=1 Tax=Paenibacillus arenosi TaxID=2774142 RepID=A0ABR9AZQ9_9BACL|nr:hypothetical protein [Paenibacillus arenosi]MBD8499636.1 hypothetical protein [Paenibacillus arenosi]